jgi:hypothetical protein
MTEAISATGSELESISKASQQREAKYSIVFTDGQSSILARFQKEK